MSRARPAVTPEREALLLPHADEYRASAERAMVRAAQPRSLASYVRWARWAYGQEPPVRLHTRATGDDGAPAWSGEFLAWMRAVDSRSVACAADDDGYLRWPFRCALFQFHGRFEDTPRARMADLALSIAATTEELPLIGLRHGIAPPWVVPVAAAEALRRLWVTYSPLVAG